MGSDQFWSRKQKSDSHDITAWLVSRNKIGIQAQHGTPPLYDLFTPGQQFSYMTPPPSNKRTSPQDHLPVYYSDLQTTTRISPKPKYFDSRQLSRPEAIESR